VQVVGPLGDLHAPPVQRECRDGVSALHLQPTQQVQYERHAAVVPHPFRQAQRGLEVRASFDDVPEGQIDLADPHQRRNLADLGPDDPRRGHRELVHRHGVRVLAVAVEEDDGGVDEPPDMIVMPVRGRRPDGCEQVRPLPVEPRLRLRRTAGHERLYPAFHIELGRTAPTRIEHSVRVHGRRQVVAHQPTEGRVPLGHRLVCLRAVPGELPDEVVEPVSIQRLGLLEQMRRGENAQTTHGLDPGPAIQRTGRLDAEIGSRMQAEQPKQPPFRFTEHAV
jgi:hypothetical protein